MCSEDGLSKAHLATKIIFNSDYTGLKAEEVALAFNGDPRLVLYDEAELYASTITKVAAAHGLVRSTCKPHTRNPLPTRTNQYTCSTAAARHLIDAGGLYINNQQIADHRNAKIDRSQLIDGRILVMRAGRDKHLIVMLR